MLRELESISVRVAFEGAVRQETRAALSEALGSLGFQAGRPADVTLRVTDEWDEEIGTGLCVVRARVHFEGGETAEASGIGPDKWVALGHARALLAREVSNKIMDFLDLF